MLDGGNVMTDTSEGLARERRDDTGIFEVSDRYIRDCAALDPMLASFWGIPGYDHEITDYSPDGWEARLDLQRTTLDRLATVVPHEPGDRIAIDVMRERVQAECGLIESGEYHRWLTVMNSHHEYIREVFDFMPRESVDDWRNVRARLIAVPEALDRLRASFVYAAERGQVAARRQAIACAAQCDVWGSPDGCFADLRDECETFDLTLEAQQAAAAYIELGTWFRTDYAAIATPHDPVGRERYRLFARYHNGTDLDVDETYQWGWAELHEIESRVAELIEQISPGSSRDECIEQLKTDPQRSVHGADRFVGWGQELIERTIDELDGTYFEIAAPLRRCQAMPAPAGGPDISYYTPPSEDFSRPGQIWLPVTGKERFPLWDAVTTMYHESVPGHHLQLGRMMYRADSLTRFQRLGVAIPGHGEGWALYAERLMHELGYLDDPAFELGWLIGQALRAVRVILDIGLHCEMRIPDAESFHPGEVWQADWGHQFLIQRTGHLSEFLSSEVDRYLGMPGQAISYKIGERVWLDGRDGARRRMGDDFDLRRFHERALDMGGMGLDQLRTELSTIDLSENPR